jgi:hypothetical protein
MPKRNRVYGLAEIMVVCTVKLGDKERLDKEQIGVNLLHKDKEHLALRNNFRVTKNFLITKFDYIISRNIDKIEISMLLEPFQVGSG